MAYPTVTLPLPESTARARGLAGTVLSEGQVPRSGWPSQSGREDPCAGLLFREVMAEPCLR